MNRCVAETGSSKRKFSGNWDIKANRTLPSCGTDLGRLLLHLDSRDFAPEKKPSQKFKVTPSQIMSKTITLAVVAFLVHFIIISTFAVKGGTYYSNQI